MIEQLNQTFDFVLASESPRRQSLLKSMGIQFSVRKSTLSEEKYPEEFTPENVSEFIARQKAIHTSLLSDKELIITADTIVVIEDVILGKPKNYSDAFQMLKRLSGKTHSVITGICLRDTNHSESFHASTNVRFAALDDTEIRNYIERYKPYDKAGAYGIQEWIGYIGIEHIEGSYFNVVGLPTHSLYTHLVSRIKNR
jgi:septum formation protein